MRPDGADILDRLDEATRIITAAGELAMTYFTRLSELVVRDKGIQDMVSEADIAVERLIRDQLKAAYPDDAFLGEESGPVDLDGSAGVWVVDPIDGTQPFVNGIRSWCISVAYVRRDRLELGLVYNPALPELFTGALGQTATLNGRPISPSRATSVADGLTFLGCSPRVTADEVVPVLDRLLRADGMFVRSGSGALGLCDVACGRLVGYVEPHINSWDCLGAIAVLTAAGARVNDYLNPRALLEGNRIIAATPAAFDQLVEILGLGS